MKILIANCVYKKGSTGKIVYDTQKYLEDNGHKTLVCYGNFEVESDLPCNKFCSDFEVHLSSILTKLGNKQYKGSPVSTHRLISIIKREQPHVVHLHCMNGSCVDLYALLDFLAKSMIPTVVTHHAEFYYTGSCSHAFECEQWYRNQCEQCPRLRFATHNRIFADAHKPWKALYESFNKFSPGFLKFTAVSPWVRSRSLMSPIVNKFECITVLNGVETSVFHYKDDCRLKLCDRIGTDSKVIFFSSASFRPFDENDIKGGKYILELAKLLPDYKFVIAALDVDTSIELPSNILLWGPAKSQDELADLYSYADITVIASQRETFSMVTAESLCCGTPVVGFTAGGPESIAIPEYTKFVETRDSRQLADAISEMIESNLDKNAVSNFAQQIYSKEQMAKSYLDIYKSF